MISILLLSHPFPELQLFAVFFSPNRSTGPIRSSGRNVCVSVWCPSSVFFLTWMKSAFSRGLSPLFGAKKKLTPAETKILVLLSASVKRFGVPRMRFFFLVKFCHSRVLQPQCSTFCAGPKKIAGRPINGLV